jgi:cysteine desulfuration protein SufE
MTTTGLEPLTPDDLVQNFQLLEDWEDRFHYLLDLGRQVPAIDDAQKTDANRVGGCQSQVWLEAWTTDDDPPRFTFVANSDAQLVNGLIAILMVIYNGRPVDEVARTDATPVLRDLGLEEHLSPTRRNGMHAIMQRVRGLAADRASDSVA